MIRSTGRWYAVRAVVWFVGTPRRPISFDWGMNISDTGMLSALQGYFDAEFRSHELDPNGGSGARTPASLRQLSPVRPR